MNCGGGRAGPFGFGIGAGRANDGNGKINGGTAAVGSERGRFQWTVLFVTGLATTWGLPRFNWPIVFGFKYMGCGPTLNKWVIGLIGVNEDVAITTDFKLVAVAVFVVVVAVVVVAVIVAVVVARTGIVALLRVSVEASLMSPISTASSISSSSSDSLLLLLLLKLLLSLLLLLESAELLLLELNVAAQSFNAETG